MRVIVEADVGRLEFTEALDKYLAMCIDEDIGYIGSGNGAPEDDPRRVSPSFSRSVVPSSSSVTR